MSEYLLFKLLSIFILLTDITKGENFTRRYMTMDNISNGFQTKQSRLFSFTTDDNGEISIEIQFSVPFIRIPVKRALDVGQGTLANFNIASLAVGGAIALFTGLILPTFTKTVDRKPFKPYHSKYGKIHKEESVEWWRFMAVLEQTLIENNVDSTTCMQKAICWIVQSSLNQHKIVDTLISNQWIKEVLDGTPLQSAIDVGLENKNCGDEYKSCKLSKKMLNEFIQQITKAISLT